MIEIITKPDVTGLGRVVVDGKFYGVPIVALEELVQAKAEIVRNREAIAALVQALKDIHGHPNCRHEVEAQLGHETSAVTTT